MRKQTGITLIALVITIIILLILAGVVLSLAIGKSGIIDNAELAGEETNKQTATEKINLKITNSQMNSYANNQRMPTLQELADDFCEDNEIEYVTLESKKLAGLDKIEVGENSSIFTKLKEYPYEFEINSSLQIISTNGIKNITEKLANRIYKLGTYSSEAVSKGGGISTRMEEINTIEIDIKQKYSDYQNLSVDNFFAIDELQFGAADTSSSYKSYGCYTTVIKNYDNIEGILTIMKPYAWRDSADNSLDECYLGTTNIYIVENTDITDL